MTTINVNNFLLSLMAEIESRSGLAWVTGVPTAPRSLWLHEIVDSSATDPASVIRCYGGESPSAIWGRKLTLSLQVLTRGSQASPVLSQAWVLQEAMLSDQGHPAVHCLRA